ncbi:Alkyldihydroxyacetonephosphate synthase [Enhygromyxa salina]|uniref:Alkyldihydroxyacetonephosphate synthase n=1 Tax=Enhygromyxa salina TaxID=215803 RepID=A0A0C2DCJ9_9BACT|nr:FAD-binding oxidoreductase [Enhygromyxa salina]KIG17442.1 Alkyldihydroxyacetonephosphate synthase [Enhygromyxa salina]
MTINRQTLRWNGWGARDRAFEFGDHADAVWTWLRSELGLAAFERRPAVPLEELVLPKITLAAEARVALEGIVGPQWVRADPYERAFHARGQSYHDLLRLRAGEVETAPDLVVYPRAEQVQAVLAWADAHEVAVVPYGGGSSVVGGVSGEAGQHRAVVTLDTTRMDRLLRLDETSHTATFEAGIYGPQLEQALQDRGFTLGHYPQSFEFSTLGGWIAARGAGQQSSRYGGAATWLVGAKLATPAGEWSTGAFPASAAGPDFNHLIAGSEGALGIITQATVRLHRSPSARDYRGCLFPDFHHGVAAIRELVQAEVPLATLRLSDPSETDFFSEFAKARKPPSTGRRVAGRALEAMGYGGDRCVLIIGHEGERGAVDAAHTRTNAIVRRNRGIPLGRGAGQSWYRDRFALPYIRDPLLDRGIAVDTLETSTSWSNLLPLHQAVSSAISAAASATLRRGQRAMMMAHVSHAYVDGASLYFTIVFPQAPAGEELQQWQAIKAAACQAIVDHGGTISHHHGVGTDHRAYLTHEKGPLGVRLLGAIKSELDPRGIMNPGKLVR